MNGVISWLKPLAGVLCAGLTLLFGGMDTILLVLIFLMATDYVSGVWSAALSGTLSSKKGFSGLFKKVMILAIVAVGHMIGEIVSIPEIRSLVIGFYIANEGISILENAGELGVPLPEKLIEVLECLKTKNDIQ